jgi:hypothetical protein
MLEDLEGHGLTEQAWANIKLLHELKGLFFILPPHVLFRHASFVSFDLIWEIGFVNIKQDTANVSENKRDKFIKLDFQDATDKTSVLLLIHGGYLGV